MRRWLTSGAITLLVTGCHGTALTPQQERAFMRFDVCREATGARSAEIREVAPDGRLVSWVGEGRDRQAMRECLTTRYGMRWVDEAQTLRDEIMRQLHSLANARAAVDLEGGLPPQATFGGRMVTVRGHELFLTEVTIMARRSGSDFLGRWSTHDGSIGGFSVALGRDPRHRFSARQDLPCGADFIGEIVIQNGGRRIYGHHSGRSCKGPVDVYFVVDRRD